jgi:hypothetical protein
LVGTNLRFSIKASVTIQINARSGEHTWSSEECGKSGNVPGFSQPFFLNKWCLWIMDFTDTH